MRPFLAKGLPELSVPPVEPMVIEELAMENNAGAVRIKALFTNITAKGPSNFTVRDVRSDISVSLQNEMEMRRLGKNVPILIYWRTDSAFNQ